MSSLNDAIYFEQMSISLLQLLKFRVILYSLNMFPSEVFLHPEGQLLTKSIHSFTQQMLKVQGSQHQCHLVTMLRKVTNNMTFPFLLEWHYLKDLNYLLLAFPL